MLKSKLNEKGQGIVEYALLLAFILGIAMVSFNSGLRSSITSIFDNTVAALTTSSSDNLSTPEGRLSHDFSSMKGIGEALSSVFFRTWGDASIDNFEKIDNPIAMPKNFITLVVLPDGTIDACIDGVEGKGGYAWYSGFSDENKAIYGEQLKMAGIDLTAAGIESTRQKLAIASAGDESLLKNGYTISFGHKDGNMGVYYKSFNHSVTSENYKTAARFDHTVNSNNDWYVTDISDKIK